MVSCQLVNILLQHTSNGKISSSCRRPWEGACVFQMLVLYATTFWVTTKKAINNLETIRNTDQESYCNRSIYYYSNANPNPCMLKNMLKKSPQKLFNYFFTYLTTLWFLCLQCHHEITDAIIYIYRLHSTVSQDRSIAVNTFRNTGWQYSLFCFVDWKICSCQ